MARKKKQVKKQPQTAAKNNRVHKGAALRTRDEFLLGGKAKEEYKNKPKQYYRVVYTIEINQNNELAVVKRTTKKGRHLKTQPQNKFHEEIYTKDNQGEGIRIGRKFTRSEQDDIANEDVKYIKKRIAHYPDTEEKLKEFRSRKNGTKKPSK